MDKTKEERTKKAAMSRFLYFTEISQDYCFLWCLDQMLEF